MDPTEIARWDQVVDMDVPQRGTVLCLVLAEQVETREAPYGGPRARIHLPPADSLSLFRSRFRRSRTRLSARVCADGLATASAETPGCFDIALSGGNVSVGPNSSTAVRLM